MSIWLRYTYLKSRFGEQAKLCEPEEGHCVKTNGVSDGCPSQSRLSPVALCGRAHTTIHNPRQKGRQYLKHHLLYLRYFSDVRTVKGGRTAKGVTSVSFVCTSKYIFLHSRHTRRQDGGNSLSSSAFPYLPYCGPDTAHHVKHSLSCPNTVVGTSRRGYVLRGRHLSRRQNDT